MCAVWRVFASCIVMGALAAGLAATPALAHEAPSQAEQAMTADQLFARTSQRAAALAAAAYVPPADDLPHAFRDLDYDGYRKLRPRPDRMVWGKAGNPFAVLPLPRGGLYQARVALHFLNAAGAELANPPASVDFVDYPWASDRDRRELGASGWRAISRPGEAGVGYEFAVFQGGTYFRVVGEGQFYGVSARALAIGAGSAAGEEFPRFTDFWIFEPHSGDDSLTFIALADSPSAAAAYRFVLRPGSDAAIDVVADIHPRVDISEAGVAPLSSMYLHGRADPRESDSQRAEVHDSDGLSILTASGEHIWRPLTNPRAVEVSAFGATPAAFGLEQRQREPSAFADAEAKYERRPSVRIEPAGDWGAGEIRLLEIPTDNEYADNIAAFWRPAAAWRAGSVQRLAYRLAWSATPAPSTIARVIATDVALAPESQSLQRISIDFAGAPDFATKPLRPDVWSTSGVLSNISVTLLADDRARVCFDLDPGKSAVIELHAALADSRSQQTETWLFRWTPE